MKAKRAGAKSGSKSASSRSSAKKKISASRGNAKRSGAAGKSTTTKRRAMSTKTSADNTRSKKSGANAKTTKRARTAMPRVTATAKSKAKKSGAKVGSDVRAARRVGGRGDFGAKADDRRSRDYVSGEIRHNDPGAATQRSNNDGDRTSGAGSNVSGPGSGSGGDLDTDFVGVAGGSGLSQSGPDADEGADEVSSDENVSDHFAAPGRKGHAARGAAAQRGSTVDNSGGDLSTTGDGQGSGSVVNPMARNDDSFASEISNDEAAGADNSPSEV